MPQALAVLTTADRETRIREAAYFRFVARGYVHGHDLDDWFAAEAEIDADLAIPVPIDTATPLDVTVDRAANADAAPAAWGERPPPGATADDAPARALPRTRARSQAAAEPKSPSERRMRRGGGANPVDPALTVRAITAAPWVAPERDPKSRKRLT